MSAAAIDVAVGLQHACAVLASGQVECWGRNDVGQLGRSPGSSEDARCANGLFCNPLPRPVLDVSTARFAASGEGVSCAEVDLQQSLRCWGAGAAGVLGGADAGPQRNVDIALLGMASSVRRHACIASADGKAQCWGPNEYGQLGHLPGTENDATDAGTLHNAEPTVVAAISNVKQVAVSANSSCALLTDQSVWCWGSTEGGTVGEATGPVAPPTRIAVSGALQIAMSVEAACALLSDGSVWCWGSNRHGELGRGFVGSNGSTANMRPCTQPACFPRPVPTLLSGSAVRLAGSASSFFAQRSDGALYAWGSNDRGQLGHAPMTEGDERPASVAIPVNALPRQVSFGEP